MCWASCSVLLECQLPGSNLWRLEPNFLFLSFFPSHPPSFLLCLFHYVPWHSLQPLPTIIPLLFPVKLTALYYLVIDGITEYLTYFIIFSRFIHSYDLYMKGKIVYTIMLLPPWGCIQTQEMRQPQTEALEQNNFYTPQAVQLGILPHHWKV